MIVDPEEAQRRGLRRKAGKKISAAGMGALLSLLAGSALLGAGLSPLLARSRSHADWLDPAVVERRAAVRQDLERDVSVSSPAPADRGRFPLAQIQRSGRGISRSCP
jgi:hypothetical protein